MKVPAGKTIYFGSRKFKAGEYLPPVLSEKFPEEEKEPDFEFLKTLEELEEKPKKKRKYTRKKKDSGKLKTTG